MGSGWSQDTTRLNASDSTTYDSLVLRGTQLYVSSGDSVDVPVTYKARDSILFDLPGKLIHLYGEASILYQTMDLQADYILIDMNNSTVTATPLKDSLNKETGIPKFKDKDQSFNAKNIKYNFKSRKGIVTEVISKEADVFIHGEKSKFIGEDSLHKGDNVIYNRHGIFTTCDADEPHFGIYSNRQKIIPNKLIIVGPSIVKIHNVPAVPLMLPFGFFPITKNKSSGLIFPKNYVYDQNLGFGLSGIGYYFALTDYYDLKLENSIWFKGSFTTKATTQYKLKYKYQGNLILDYADLNREQFDSYKKTRSRTFKIDWSHSQLQGAHPYRSLSGRINLSLNPFDRLVNNDYYSQTNNLLYSNLNFNYNFPNSPFVFSAGFNHDQNLNTRVINIRFPTLNLNMRSISPFKRKSGSLGAERWYEKITLNYGTQFANRVTTYDSILLTQHTLDTMLYGFKHNASLDINFKVLKYINVVPQVSYQEEWFFKNIEKTFDPDTVFKRIVNDNDSLLRIDTLYGTTIDHISGKFSSLRTMNASLSMNTQLYGQIQSKKGWFRGIRHVLSPSVSFSFAPNYRKAPFNYFDSVDRDSRPAYNYKQEYLVFANSPFGTSSVPNENFNISYGINNRVEMKYYSRRDTAIKKLSLLDNFAISGNYNVYADSFKMSNFVGFGRMSYFKGFTAITFNVEFDPYYHEVVNGKDIRRKEYLIDQSKKLVNLTRAGIGFSSNLTIPQLIRFIMGNETKQHDLPTFGSLFDAYSISHQLSYTFERNSRGVDTFYLSVNSITSYGYIQLTPKWKINIGQIGYDFKNKSLTYPDFGFERDLHCWVMNFNYRPQNKAFTFFIGVKPGSLDFIKIPNNRNLTGSGF